MSVFAAIADPTRRQIVELLAEGELPAGVIAARFPISRPAISRHLRVLREAGVASAREVAQQRLYRLEPAALDELDAWVTRMRTLWQSPLDETPQPEPKSERRDRPRRSPARRRRRRRRS